MQEPALVQPTAEASTLTQKFIQKLIQKLRIATKATKLLVHFSLGGILIPTLGFWLPFNTSFHKKITQWWLKRACNILSLTVKIKGQLPSDPGFFVSNHVSWMDIIVIGGHTPIRFLSKAEVRQWPIIGWFAACTGTLFIQRGNGKSTVMANIIQEELGKGESILVFPEATSTDGKQVRRFFPNMFSAPINANAPVHPLAIHYSENGSPSSKAPFINDDEFFSHLLSILKSDNINVTLHALNSISTNIDSRRKVVSDLAREQITDAIL